jgi:hypothetical protein
MFSSRQLPPQAKWCPPNVCAGLRSLIAACSEIRAFSSSDKAALCPAPPLSSAPKTDAKNAHFERRHSFVSLKSQEPPPLDLVPKAVEKHAVENLASASPSSKQPHTPSSAVPPLDMSKLSSRNRENFHAPCVGLLQSHRVVCPSMFMSSSSDNVNVSFCLPRGMNKVFRSRHVQLLAPLPPQHHPIITSRQSISHTYRKNQKHL